MQRNRETQSRAGRSSLGTSRKRAAPDAATTSSFTYNPRQDASDRRKVRSDYRTLIAQAEESKRDSSLKPKDLVELVAKVDELHERVVAPSESILDTKTLTSMSEMGARMAKKMKLNPNAFDTHELMTRLARFLGGEAAPVRRGSAREESDDDADSDEAGRGGSGRNIDQWDWAKLGRLASSVSKRAVTMDFLLGPLEIAPKLRKAVTQRRQDDAPAERTAPRALQQHDLHDATGRESTSAIRNVAQLLQQHGPNGVCLFSFAVDPDSFVNTVENFFHVSFLIKENKASLRTDAEGNTILTAAQPPSTASSEGEEQEASKSKQFIMEIDWPTYLESIQLYDIRASVIPTRQNRVDPLSGRQALASLAAATADRRGRSQTHTHRRVV